MKEQVYAPDPLNRQASVLVDAQTDIKTAIKQSVLSGMGSRHVKLKVQEIINNAISKISSPVLKQDGRIALMRFADKAYSQFIADLNSIAPQILPAVIVIMNAITTKPMHGKIYYPNTQAEVKAASALSYSATNKGIPLEEFTKTYIEKVDKALNNLAKEKALDPNDITGRNTLRNLAEMQVRYERHQSDIQDFRERGIKLVVCSVHADCSDRCRDWQGLVYSLDGSTGYTEDGKRFQPLENATDRNFTKRGVPNGLLGFNCRHKLYEYKPHMVIPSVSASVQRREYAITKTQRELEREVINAREQALGNKGVNGELYKKWAKIAKERYAYYKAYCQKNGRAYYPDRVKIL